MRSGRGSGSLGSCVAPISKVAEGGKEVPAVGSIPAWSELLW